MAEVRELTGRDARARVQTWLEDKLDPLTEFAIPKIIEECSEAVIADPEWLHALLADSLRPIVRQYVERYARRTRMVLAGDHVFLNPNGGDPRDRRVSRWATWLEQVDGRQMRIWDMRKPDLLKAAASRRDRAGFELKRAKLWSAMAAQLEDNQVQVKDRFNVQEIEALAAKVALERDDDNPTATPSRN